MMTQTHCFQRALDSEARAADCADAGFQAHWLAMAAQWRALAADDDSQATLARIMGVARDRSS